MLLWCLFFLLLLNLALTGGALWVAWQVQDSHARVHERLQHPFHLHGPVK